jgi:hypothetical protein
MKRVMKIEPAASAYVFSFSNETNVIIADNVRYCNDKTQNSTNFFFSYYPYFIHKEREKRRKAPVIPVL